MLIQGVFCMIGLSKERPVLGDHPKAHIHEIQWISCGFHVKSSRFHEIWWISHEIWWISCEIHLQNL